MYLSDDLILGLTIWFVAIIDLLAGLLLWPWWRLR